MTSEYERLKNQFDDILANQCEKVAKKIISGLDDEAFIEWPYHEYWSNEEYNIRLERARQRIEEIIKNILIEEGMHK